MHYLKFSEDAIHDMRRIWENSDVRSTKAEIFAQRAFDDLTYNGTAIRYRLYVTTGKKTWKKYLYLYGRHFVGRITMDKKYRDTLLVDRFSPATTYVEGTTELKTIFKLRSPSSTAPLESVAHLFTQQKKTRVPARTSRTTVINHQHNEKPKRMSAPQSKSTIHAMVDPTPRLLSQLAEMPEELRRKFWPVSSFLSTSTTNQAQQIMRRFNLQGSSSANSGKRTRQSVRNSEKPDDSSSIERLAVMEEFDFCLLNHFVDQQGTTPELLRDLLRHISNLPIRDGFRSRLWACMAISLKPDGLVNELRMMEPYFQGTDARKGCDHAWKAAVLNTIKSKQELSFQSNSHLETLVELSDRIERTDSSLAVTVKQWIDHHFRLSSKDRKLKSLPVVPVKQEVFPEQSTPLPHPSPEIASTITQMIASPTGPTDQHPGISQNPKVGIPDEDLAEAASSRDPDASPPPSRDEAELDEPRLVAEREVKMEIQSDIEPSTIHARTFLDGLSTWILSLFRRLVRIIRGNTDRRDV